MVVVVVVRGGLGCSGMGGRAEAGLEEEGGVGCVASKGRRFRDGGPQSQSGPVATARHRVAGSRVPGALRSSRVLFLDASGEAYLQGRA